jgi:hypothetical protein
MNRLRSMPLIIVGSSITHSFLKLVIHFQVDASFPIVGAS